MPYRRTPVFLGLGLALLGAGPLRAEGDPGDRFTETVSASVSASISRLRQLFQDEQPRVVRDHIVSISSQAGSLTFDYEDGGTLRIALHDGQLQVDDRIVGRYPEGGALESAWRQFLLDAARRETSEVLTQARNWQPDGLSREELGLTALLHERLALLSAPGSAPALPQLLSPAEAGGLVIRSVRPERS